jgi:hypothetical protein
MSEGQPSHESAATEPEPPPAATEPGPPPAATGPAPTPERPEPPPYKPNKELIGYIERGQKPPAEQRDRAAGAKGS